MGNSSPRGDVFDCRGYGRGVGVVEPVAYASYGSFFEFLGYLVGMVFIIPSGGVWVEGVD